MQINLIMKDSKSKKSIYKDNTDEFDSFPEQYNILGCLMIDPDFLKYCFKNGIYKDLFPSSVSQIIFESIQYNYNNNVRIDILTVSDHIRKNNLLEFIDNYPFVIAKCTNNINFQDAYSFFNKWKENNPILSNCFDTFNFNNSDLFNEFKKDKEYISAFEKLTSSQINSSERQYYAGFVRAVELLTSYQNSQLFKKPDNF